MLLTTRNSNILLERVHSQKEIACLAVNIYHEARGESSEGQLAVAFVTLNRVESEAYPNTVCGVVYQGKHKPSWKDKNKLVPIRHRCQFSWYCDGKPDIVLDFDTYEEIIELAISVWFGKVHDNTKGSLFYHADYVEPVWAQHMAMTTKIDSHIFYTSY
tara:strand:- start:1316 stop:1792 length:477 start_codon:yes stop_codon:yes gene_type:complete